MKTGTALALAAAAAVIVFLGCTFCAVGVAVVGNASVTPTATP